MCTPALYADRHTFERSTFPLPLLVLPYLQVRKDLNAGPTLHDI